MNKKVIIFCDEENHPNIQNTSFDFGPNVFCRMSTLYSCVEDANIDDCKVILVPVLDLEQAAMYATKNNIEEDYDVMYSMSMDFLLMLVKQLKQSFRFENNNRIYEKFPDGIPGEKDGFKHFDQ